MGSTPSKEQLMAKAIDSQDLSAIKVLVDELTHEQMSMMCKALVPGDENKCTILHYATWQGRRYKFNENDTKKLSSR